MASLQVRRLRWRMLSISESGSRKSESVSGFDGLFLIPMCCNVSEGVSVSEAQCLDEAIVSDVSFIPFFPMIMKMLKCLLSDERVEEYSAACCSGQDRRWWSSAAWHVSVPDQQSLLRNTLVRLQSGATTSTSHATRTRTDEHDETIDADIHCEFTLQTMI